MPKLPPIALPEGTELPTGLEVAGLLEVLYEFRSVYNHLAAPAIAHTNCLLATAAFGLLLSLRTPARWHLEVRTAKLVPRGHHGRRGFRSYYPIRGPMPVAHYVAAVGNLRVDWTARQYHEKADFPLLWTSSGEGEVFSARAQGTTRPATAQGI